MLPHVGALALAPGKMSGHVNAHASQPVHRRIGFVNSTRVSVDLRSFDA